MLFWWDLHNYLLSCASVASQSLEVWKLIKSSPSGVLTAVLFRSRLSSPSTWKLMWQSAPSGSTRWTACRVAGPLTAARRFSSAATQPAAPAATSHTSPSSCRPEEPMWVISQVKTPHLQTSIHWKNYLLFNSCFLITVNTQQSARNTRFPTSFILLVWLNCIKMCAQLGYFSLYIIITIFIFDSVALLKPKSTKHLYRSPKKTLKEFFLLFYIYFFIFNFLTFLLLNTLFYFYTK